MPDVLSGLFDFRAPLGRMVRAPLRFIPRDAEMRVLSGRLRGARWIAGAATHGCWLGTYERRIQAEFGRLVRPGAVVWDVGANVGFYTLLGARLAGPAGRVVAIEPSAENVEFLTRHVALNRVPNARIVTAAAGAQTGMARFQNSRARSQGHLDPFGDADTPVVTLDALWRAGEAAPDLIKIDVEGGERDVIAGARSLLAEARPALVVALHYDHPGNAAVARSLIDLGYEVTPLDTPAGAPIEGSIVARVPR